MQLSIEVYKQGPRLGEYFVGHTGSLLLAIKVGKQYADGRYRLWTQCVNKRANGARIKERGICTETIVDGTFVGGTL
jgi:hypothetical protein